MFQPCAGEPGLPPFCGLRMFRMFICIEEQAVSVFEARHRPNVYSRRRLLFRFRKNINEQEVRRETTLTCYFVATGGILVSSKGYGEGKLRFGAFVLGEK